jgi:hypothetical protein
MQATPEHPALKLRRGAAVRRAKPVLKGVHIGWEESSA